MDTWIKANKIPRNIAMPLQRANTLNHSPISVRCKRGTVKVSSKTRINYLRVNGYVNDRNEVPVVRILNERMGRAVGKRERERRSWG